jgi:hypothetical protein
MNGASPACLRREWLKCGLRPAYFACTYVQIRQEGTGWAPFTLWPEQRTVLSQMARERLLVVLKARQLGLTWLALTYALWLSLLRAPATVLLFSLREAEAVDLLDRVKGMYRRLPPWLQARTVDQASRTTLCLSNGSRLVAFSTRGGRSYTGALALVDEADYVPDLATFLSGVKPTVDAGGQLFLVSTSDKRRPVSAFKNLYRAAAAGTGDYHPVFVPWRARPGRDAAWYRRTRAEMHAQRGSDDDFLAEYPASPEEALAPVQLDRRIPLAWLQAVTDLLPAVEDRQAPPLAGLTVYAPPTPGAHYVIGADPAEGNPNSDASAACVVETATWAEVATLVGKLEPGVFAHALTQLARYYGGADVLVERNNHGHTVLRALLETGAVRVLPGYDGKPGWLSNVRGKPLLYDAAAEAIRDGACRVRSAETAAQLASIEAGTLRAPAGLHDDRADAFALALAALTTGHAHVTASTVAHAPREEIGRWEF